MKTSFNQLLFLSSFCFLLSNCSSQINLNKITKTVTEQVLDNGSGSTSNPLSNEEVITGLKEALTVGIENGSSKASKLDGFLKNEKIRLPFPEDAQKVKEKALQLGLDKKVEEFETTLNRAAEEAAKEAAPIFISAIKEMSIGDGVIFQKGIFQRFEEQSVIVSKYTNRPHERTVGIVTTETTVNSSVDSTLLDNASGFANENAPGADRLQLKPTLVVNSKATADSSNNFLKLAEFQYGAPIQKNSEAMLSDLGDRLAKRAFEESGDYVVEPFTLSTEQITGNTSHLAITVGSGVGYNQGHRFETAETLRIPLPKAQESINVASQQVSINFGNYIELDNVVGEFGIETNDMVLILEDKFDAISGGAVPTLPAASNTTVTYHGVTADVIGTARVRGLEQAGDVPGKSDTKYNLYLYDIQMQPGQTFSKDAQSIWHYKSTEYSLSGAETNSSVS